MFFYKSNLLTKLVSATFSASDSLPIAWFNIFLCAFSLFFLTATPSGVRLTKTSLLSISFFCLNTKPFSQSLSKLVVQEGVVAGGGTAYVNVINKVAELKSFAS